MSKSCDIAYAYIKKAILKGEFRPGDRMIEHNLVELIGVSRTPVRDAIKLLAVENYLILRPNSGAAVANWTVDELRDMFKLRALTEGLVARRAAERITAAEIGNLTDCVETIDAILAAGEPYDYPRYLEENEAFHEILCCAAGSVILCQALERLNSPSIMYQVAHNFTKQELLRSNSHHREIVDSMIAGDTDWADSAMQSHIMSSHNRMRANIMTKEAANAATTANTANDEDGT